jgi:hypothetical protein
LAVEIEHGELQALGFDPLGLAFCNFIDATEFYFRGHGALDYRFGRDIKGVFDFGTLFRITEQLGQGFPIALKQGQPRFSTAALSSDR